jgi:hypothetical protein
MHQEEKLVFYRYQGGRLDDTTMLVSCHSTALVDPAGLAESQSPSRRVTISPDQLARFALRSWFIDQ